MNFKYTTIRNIKKTSICSSICLLLCLVVASTASAAETEALEQNTYEFRGIFETGSDRSFSLFNKTTGKSAWGEIGRTILDVKLVSYDHERKEITIAKDDRIEVLALKKADESGFVSRSSPKEKASTISQEISEVNLNQVRSKIKFSIGSRGSTSSNSVTLQINGSLSETEKIALSLHEKNHISIGEVAPQQANFKADIGSR